jgi:histidyl-tRNA synthetase
MKKQLSYANQKQIPWVVLLGEEELSCEEVLLKNMESGEQEVQSLSTLSKILLEKLV